MKATFNIDESVMERLRDEAARRGTTMSALVEAGLMRILSDHPAVEGQPNALPPLPAWNSGGFRVDVAGREALHRIPDAE